MKYVVSGVRRGEWGSESDFWGLMRAYNGQGEFIPFRSEEWDGDGWFTSFIETREPVSVRSLRERFPSLEISEVRQSDAA